jgi:hypothetical protein
MLPPRLTALALLGCLTVVATTQAREQDKAPSANDAVTIVPDTAIITIKHPGTVAKGVLIITAPGLNWTQLTLRSQPLASGKYTALLGFPKLAGSGHANLDDPRLSCLKGQPCAVDFEVVDVRVRGTFAGPVDIYKGAEKVATATVSVLLADPGPAPSLTSEFLKNDALEFDSTEADSFFISLTNPAGSPARSYELKAALDSEEGSSTALTFDPASFLLDEGSTLPVRVKVSHWLSAGTYPSILHIVDMDDATLSYSKQLTVKKATSEFSRRLTLLLWVVLGAALSVVLNNAFPIRRARADRFEELTRVNAKLNACGSIGPGLRGALRSEGRRLWLLIDSVTFVNTRKDAILNEAEQGVQALSLLVTTADTVNALRAECEGIAQPIRTLRTIADHLRAAEEALMRFDAATAQSHVTAATDLARTDCNPKALADTLVSDIDQLLADRPNGGVAVHAAARTAVARAASRDKAIKHGRPQAIAQRVAQLELDRSGLAGLPLADILSVEKDFFIADVWTNTVEFVVKDDPKRFEKMLEPLLSQLTVAPAAPHTQLLIALISSNVSPTDIETALKAGHARIDCDQYARYLDLASFQFCLSSPALSAVAAARQFPSYQWEFDDKTTPPDDGDRCKHFFWAPSRWLRLWWWISRQSARVHTVTVNVTLPVVSADKYTFAREIRMQGQKNRASSLGAVQVITFCVTTGMAVLASFGAQYSTALPTTIGWGASVTALLFGFGIDQIRDRAAGK